MTLKLKVTLVGILYFVKLQMSIFLGCADKAKVLQCPACQRQFLLAGLGCLPMHIDKNSGPISELDNVWGAEQPAVAKVSLDVGGGGQSLPPHRDREGHSGSHSAYLCERDAPLPSFTIIRASR